MKYITIPNNQPKAYGNHIYVWETSANSVPWDKPPKGDTAITSDEATSTQKIEFDFQIGSGYIIGYAVAPTPNAVCATIYIPDGQLKNHAKWEYSKTTIGEPQVFKNMVLLTCKSLPDYYRGKNKNWVGIWKKESVPYNMVPMKCTPLDNDDQEITAKIEDVTIVIKSVYSIGYFMVDYLTGKTSLAATTTFKT